MAVLLVSADPAITSAVERCAAAAGAVLETVSSVPQGGHWERALLVLVGEDVLPRLTASSRRTGVIVVGAGLGAEPDAATWRQALLLGAEHVISLPQAEAWLVDRLGAAEDGSGSSGAVCAVIGAGGGAGASTLALAMGAVAARRGRRVLVVDADLHGGGIEVAAGTEGLPGARRADVRLGDGRLAPATLRDAFPTVDGLAILSARPRASDPEASLAAFVDAARGAYDLIVIDLPRALLDTVVADAHVVLACDRVRPVLAAAHLAARLPASLVAVRRVRGGTVDATDLPAVIGRPATVVFRSEAVVAEAGEHGDPLPGSGALVSAATTLLDGVGS